MDNKTPLAVSARTYAIKQSIKNQTVKTILSGLKKPLNFVLIKKIMLNSTYRNMPENKLDLSEIKFVPLFLRKNDCSQFSKRSDLLQV